eukprot:jgi/Undpi1/12260/HiC_scaffold_5.g01936.m1
MVSKSRTRSSQAVLVAALAALHVQTCSAFVTPASSLGARNAAAGISSAKGWNTAGVREASSRGAVAPRRVAVETAEGQQLEKLKFLTPKTARATKAAVGTPAYVYDAATLKSNAEACLAFPHAYGLTVRYAMKSLPNKAVLQLFNSLGLSFDCSSGWEVKRAIAAGVSPEKLCLRFETRSTLSPDVTADVTARGGEVAVGVGPVALESSPGCTSVKELPVDAAELLGMGVGINACSLSQLRRLAQEAPGSSIGVRFNPGLGSGGTKSTNVGGPSSSFGERMVVMLVLAVGLEEAGLVVVVDWLWCCQGSVVVPGAVVVVAVVVVGIWYEWADEVKEICAGGDLTVSRVHTHIGSGSDPAVWQKVSGMSLDLVRQFPTVTTLNLGGGYKTGRMSGEESTDLQAIGAPVKGDFVKFAEETGRELKLEIEPGTFLVANAGSMVCSVQDLVSTGALGYEFIKLDAGMTELLRPSLYGALHPIVVVPSKGDGTGGDATAEYVVVGHCCESGDLLTPMPGSASEIDTRTLEKAEIGDLIVVEGCGAYVAGMSAKNYNSFPEAPEVLLDASGELHVVRRRQSVEQIFENEMSLPDGVA